MIGKEVDIPGDWNIEKVNRLAGYLVNNIGLQTKFYLFIDPISFHKLHNDLENLRNYSYTPQFNSIDQSELMIYCTNGQVYITHTSETDHVTFTHDGINNKYYISNKLKEYKADFDAIVNGD